MPMVSASLWTMNPEFANAPTGYAIQLSCRMRILLERSALRNGAEFGRLRRRGAQRELTAPAAPPRAGPMSAG